MSIQTDLAVQERENEFHIDQVLALLDERDGQEALSDTQLIEFDDLQGRRQNLR